MPSDIEATMPWEVDNVSPDAGGLKTILNGVLGVIALMVILTLGLFGWNKAKSTAGMDSESRATLEVK
jgi:alanine dehydrogenase